MESVARGRGKNKRTWTVKEDEKLIEASQDLCVNGSWKGENSFKNGYLLQLEKVLEEKLPGCGLKDMMLACENDVFDEWVRTHKDASGLYSKPFPHLDALGEIFSKDRTNGLGAETFADAVEELDREERNTDNGDTWADGTDNIEVSDTQSHTNTLSERGGSGQPCRKKVRWADVMANNLENLAGNIGTFVQEIVPHFGRIAGAMEHENELAEKVVEKLLKIDGLNVDDVMKAVDILTAEPSKAMVFLAMPANMKKKYVERIFANGG